MKERIPSQGLLGTMSAQTEQRLAATAAAHGGLIWAVDALQPEGSGTLLYVLYEVLSETPVAAAQLIHASSQALCDWLQPYQALPFAVRGPMKSSTCSGHAVHSSERSDASVIIVL